MAKRLPPTRFSTTDVQGKGSYVELSGLKIRERKAYIVASKEEDFSALSQGAELLTNHIKGWNWVDDDGVRLPLPSEDPLVVDELTDAETKMLADLLMNPDVKN